MKVLNFLCKSCLLACIFFLQIANLFFLNISIYVRVSLVKFEVLSSLTLIANAAYNEPTPKTTLDKNIEFLLKNMPVIFKTIFVSKLKFSHLKIKFAIRLISLSLSFVHSSVFMCLILNLGDFSLSLNDCQYFQKSKKVSIFH